MKKEKGQYEASDDGKGILASLRRLWNQFWEKLPPRRRRLVIGIVATAAVIAAISILPKSLFQSFSCQPENPPQNFLSSNGIFIDNQVIVVGRRDDVEAVIATPSSRATITPETPPTTSTLLAVATPTVTGTPAAPGTPATPETPVVSAPSAGPEKVILNLVEGCDMSYLNTRKALGSGAPVASGPWVMRLYEIPNGSEVGSVISDIHDKAEGRAISADPNYITRLSDLTDDPCVLTGDGTGGGGKPFGMPGTVDPKAYNASRPEEAFKTQWAFAGPQSVYLTISSTPASTPTSTPTGRDVQVGVFDTSPYRRSSPFFKRVAEGVPSPLGFTQWDAGGRTMLSNHGLFVAKLIHGIAPKSSIELIRVLNDDGCGELWVLNKGLEDYKSRMSARTGSLDDTVINMSLGIHVEKEDDDKGSEQDNTGSPENDSGPEAEPSDGTQDAPDAGTEDAETLKRLIGQAHDMGAVIVAAAGNDSKRTKLNGVTTDEIAAMLVPASYDNVIGVAASNDRGERSCFSNFGDVAAPGGDGGEKADKDKDPNKVPDPKEPINLCEPRTATWDKTPNECRDMATCPYGLVSLAETRDGPRYVLWSGTSFATPLVSGLAALAYEELTRDQVTCVIEDGTRSIVGKPPSDPTKGIISISDSLSTAVITQCKKKYPSSPSYE